MNKRLYSEVYAILEALAEDFGSEYVSRIPGNVITFIANSRDESYSPILDENKGYHEQGLSEDAIAILAMLKLNYLAETNEEKQELLELLNTNEETLNEKLRGATSTRELMKLLKKKH
ncbi:hypothetical protein FACS189425_06630 [Clostridia bacterium]|nr:hypothetical protein FACS189425_06630 [Clostridia bacterium]